MTVVANLDPVHSGNIDNVKVVLASVLPVSYPPSFYKDMVKGKISALVARIKDRTVGCVAWHNEREGLVHVLALGVLATHRQRGVASILLERCLEGSSGAYLYLQTDNTEALQFYSKRGFKVCQTVEGYYKRVACTTAFKMEQCR